MNGARWRRLGVATACSLAAVAVVTGAIALFEPYVPVLSLGVLYIFAVLPVAVVWGLRFALPVSVAEHARVQLVLPAAEAHASLSDGENWFALAVYLATAVVVSELAARARRRAVAAEQRERESTLLADLATELLAGQRLDDQLAEIAGRAAAVLGVDRAEIELGPERARHGRLVPYVLDAAGRQIGTIFTSRWIECRGPTSSAGSFLRWPRCSRLRRSVTGWRARRSRPRRSAAATWSRLRCSGPSPTTCARLSPASATAIGALRSRVAHAHGRGPARAAGDDRARVEPPRHGSSATCSTSRGSKRRAVAPQLEAWELADLVHEAVDTLGAREPRRGRRRDAGRRRRRRPGPAGRSRT